MESIAINNRYILRKVLGSGGMGVVYQATDRLSGEEVALKQVTVSPQQLMFASRAGAKNLKLALAQEFRTLTSLRHPNIVPVRDYGFDAQRQPFFTMDLLEDAQTIVDAGTTKPLDRKIDFLIQLLQALAYLHRHGVLHRDLKPGNIVVVDGEVNLLDFGLSLVTEGSVAEVTQSTTGTFAYMAPELFQGYPPSRRSDLYAVGMVAYVMFSGSYPFEVSNIAMLINQILSSPIDLTEVGPNVSLAEVVARLLDRNPADRYQTANDTIRAFCEATNTEVPAESIEIRESYLQAAPFIGREEELETLTIGLQQAIAGQGSAWLVGGESGVGKTRLCDELRSLALVEETGVVRGQAVSEGGSAYQLWNETLKWLALQVDLSDEEGSMLKLFVPNIEAMQDKEFPPPPPIEPQQVSVRLFHTMRAILGRQTIPIVLILEDLQWARSESVEMLRRVNGLTAELPLMIVGNFRDDEQPKLPESLSTMQTMKLERFDEKRIAELSASMLGQAGKRPDVVAFLQRETEGNIFFLVEVVRALAEQAGELGQIGEMTLPEHISSSGVQEIVQRRLWQIPAEAQSLLKRAAIAGRQLDLRVLQAHIDHGMVSLTGDLEQWLTICAEAAVLDAIDDDWRFSHDKLRERVLETLGDDQRIPLYQEVAEMIEWVYPDNPDQAANLAYFWGVVGDQEKTLAYLKVAGENAVVSGASMEAISYFSQALEVLESLPEAPDPARQELELQVALGSPMVAVKGWAAEEVGQVYLRAYDLCQQVGETPLLIPTLGGLITYYLNEVVLDKAAELANQLLEVVLPTGDPNLLVAAHLLAGIGPSLSGEFELARSHWEQAITLYKPEQHATQVAMFGWDFGVNARSWLAYGALWHLGYPTQALARVEESLSMTEQLRHPFTHSWALNFAGNVNLFSGNLEAAKKCALTSISLAREHDFLQLLGSALSLYGMTLVRQDLLGEGIEQMQQGIAIYDATRSKFHRPLRYAELAKALAQAGQVEEGLTLLEETLSKINETNERQWEAEVHRQLGELWLIKSRDQVQAEVHFRTAIEVAQKLRAKSLELRATISLARLWESQGRRKEAHQILAEIYDWFTEGFETADLKEAKALLEELS
jgi:predicted ATPase